MDEDVAKSWIKVWYASCIYLENLLNSLVIKLLRLGFKYASCLYLENLLDSLVLLCLLWNLCLLLLN